MNILNPESALWTGPARQVVPLDRGAVPSPADPPEAGRLHEYFAPTAADAPAAAAAALLAADCGSRLPLIWIRSEAAVRRFGQVHGPGLAALGLDPARLRLLMLASEADMLRAAADLLRSTAAALLLELHGPAAGLDLTASRRLALAAARGRAPAILLRVEAEPRASAAWRRWAVRRLPSAVSRRSFGNPPEAPAFEFELLRNRRGPAGACHRLTWCNGWTPEEADDALSRLSLSLPADGPARRGHG